MVEEFSEEDLKDALISLLEEEKIIAQCPKCNTLLTTTQVKISKCTQCFDIVFNDIRVYARDAIGQA